LVKDKILEIKPRDASPRDPREGNKRPLSKKQEGPEKNNKQDLIKRIGGLITRQPIMFMGTVIHQSCTEMDFHRAAKG
jgi:hypothetical protein